jgi:hypothetical protein
MVLVDNIMEPTLQNQTPREDDLQTAASYFARDAQAQCIDVSAMAFPIGHKSPNEEMLSAVAVKLRYLILGIEKAVVSNQDIVQSSVPQSWNLLLHSGFLKEPILIDFVLAQFASDRLTARVLENSNTRLVDQLPAQLLSDSSLLIADAAQTLLASETHMRRSPEFIYQQLSSELLHQTTWRVVAALQVLTGQKNEVHISNSKRLLSNHDEGNSVRAASRKIVHFLTGREENAVLNPAKSGVAIFVASLAARTGLDHDHILRLIDGHSSAPLALILRACDLTRETAMEIICLFKGFNLTPLEISYVDRHFETLTRGDAQSDLASWRAERECYLAFPELQKAT